MKDFYIHEIDGLFYVDVYAGTFNPDTQSWYTHVACFETRPEAQAYSNTHIIVG